MTTRFWKLGIVWATLAVATLLSVVASGGPPRRMGPTWANHNTRSAEENISPHYWAPNGQSVSYVSERARVVPIPDRASLVDEVAAVPAQDRVRIVVDLTSAVKGLYVIRGRERSVLPIEVRGQGNAAVDNEFIATAAFENYRQDPNAGPPDAVVVDYETGSVGFRRGRNLLSTTPATLPTFVPPITELSPQPRLDHLAER